MKTTHQKNGTGGTVMLPRTPSLKSRWGLNRAQHVFNRQALSLLPVCFLCLERYFSQGIVCVRKKKFCVSAQQIIGDRELLFVKYFKNKFLHSWNMKIIFPGFN